MIAHKTGDIFTVEAGVIMHGCNTYGVMGAGVANTVREKYPKAYTDYKKICDLAGDYNERVELVGTVHFATVSEDLTIANAFTQHHPGPDATLYAIRQCLVRVMQHGKMHNVPVHSVMIGAGIGGLAWDDVYEEYMSVDAFFPDVPLNIWKYAPGN